MDIEFLTKKYKNKMTTLSFGGYEFYFLSEAINSVRTNVSKLKLLTNKLASNKSKTVFKKN